MENNLDQEPFQNLSSESVLCIAILWSEVFTVSAGFVSSIVVKDESLETSVIVPFSNFWSPRIN